MRLFTRPNRLAEIKANPSKALNIMVQSLYLRELANRYHGIYHLVHHAAPKVA